MSDFLVYPWIEMRKMPPIEKQAMIVTQSYCK